MLTKIEHKVLIGFIGTFIILLITGWFLFRQNQRVVESGQWIGHTARVLQAVAEFQGQLANLNIELRDPVHPTGIVGLQRRAGALSTQAVKLRQLTADNPRQRQNVNRLLALLSEKRNRLSEPTAGETVVHRRIKWLDQQILQQLAVIQDAERELLTIRLVEYQRRSTGANLFFAGLSFLTIAVLGVVYLMLARNMSAQRRTAEKLRKLNRQYESNVVQLKQLNQELESFTYTVSHDLRAPLRAIHGYTRILDEDHVQHLDDEARRLMKIIAGNATQMGQLIDDLLAFSRLGRKELTRHKIDMQGLVEEVIAELSIVSDKVRWTIEPIRPAQGDEGMIRQVWVNLLSNALKYSKDRDPQLIRISSASMNGELHYCVEDNGAGFDMTYYDKLFGVFQRLHDANEFEGTGVGLAIAHRIISKHKGRIWATAEVDKGARFCFTIPEE